MKIFIRLVAPIILLINGITLAFAKDIFDANVDTSKDQEKLRKTKLTLFII